MIAGFTKDREMALSRLRQKYAKNKQQNMNNYSIAEDNYVVNNDSNNNNNINLKQHVSVAAPPPQIDIVKTEFTDNPTDNHFFVTQLHMEPSKCLLLRLPKITLNMLQDIGWVKIESSVKLIWQVSLWKNEFRITESINIDTAVDRGANMVVLENIGKDTNQIRCVLKRKEINYKIGNKYNNDVGKASSIKRNMKLYEATFIFDNTNMNKWGNSIIKPIGSSSKRFIRLITFCIKDGISMENNKNIISSSSNIELDGNNNSRKRDEERKTSNKSNEINNISSDDMKIFRIGVDVEIAATKHIVSNSALFVNFFSKLVNQVLANQMQPDQCLNEYLRYINRTNINIVSSCQTYMLIILSNVFKSSVEHNNRHPNVQQGLLKHDWIYPLLTTSIIENMKRKSVTRHDRLFVIQEFWRIVPDVMIVDTINHLFHLVSEIQNISYSSFVNETTVEHELVFQALYVLSCILTAGALLIPASSSSSSILTREMIDEFLIVCSKITLRAYQICGDALISYINVDEESLPSPKRFQNLRDKTSNSKSNKSSNQKNINCNIFFLILSSILGLGLQSDTVLEVTSDLGMIVQYLDPLDFDYWLGFFVHILEKDHYSNEYKDQITSIIVEIFVRIQEQRLNRKLELSSLPLFSKLLIGSRSITLMLALAESLLHSNGNLHVWVNMVTFLQLVDDEHYEILETCQARNDGTTAIFVENICKTFVKHLETVGIGNGAENVAFARQMLPLWTDDSALPPILKKENGLSALCNFVELFVPSANLDVQSMEQSVRMKNAVLLSLLKWGKQFIVDLLARLGDDDSKDMSWEHVEPCYELIKANLLGLCDDIHEDIIIECLETLYLFFNKPNVEVKSNKKYNDMSNSLFKIVVSLYQYPSSTFSSSNMQINIEEKKRYKVLFSFFETNCARGNNNAFVDYFLKHKSLSLNVYVTSFIRNFLQLDIKEKERDNEVPMLVSLASIWMICHPPGAIRYLEQLAELKSALRNEKKSIFLIVALIDLINKEFHNSPSPNFLFLKTQYSSYTEEYALGTTDAMKILSKYHDKSYDGGLDALPIEYYMHPGDGGRDDRYNMGTCRAYAVRIETADDIAWTVRYGREGMTYQDFLIYLQQIYPSALFIPPTTPRRMKKVSSFSTLSNRKIIQIFPCHLIEKKKFLTSTTRQYSLFLNILDYDTDKDQNSNSTPHHSPKKHGNYGKSLAEWHSAEDVSDGTIVKCILSVKERELLTNLFGIRHGVSMRYDVCVDSYKKYNTTDACIEWLQDHFRGLKDIYRTYERNSKSSSSLNNLLNYMANMLNGEKYGEIVDMKTALRIIVYFREWEANYQSNIRKDKKLEYIKLKRVATKEGKSFPRQSVYMHHTPDENKKMSDLVLQYSRCKRVLDECYEIVSNDSSITLSEEDRAKCVKVGYLLNFNGYARVVLDF